MEALNANLQHMNTLSRGAGAVRSVKVSEQQGVAGTVLSFRRKIMMAARKRKKIGGICALLLPAAEM